MSLNSGYLTLFLSKAAILSTITQDADMLSWLTPVVTECSHMSIQM